MTSTGGEYIFLSVKTQKRKQTIEEVREVRLSLVIDEATWKGLREAAEDERTPRGRASMNALINRLIAEYLAKRGGKGGP